MSSLNWLAIITAAVSAFILGGIWYSPGFFGNAWMRENKFTDADMKERDMKKVFIGSFFLSLLMAFNLAMFLADSPAECLGNCARKTDLAWGTTAGLLSGLWPFCAIAIVGLFEKRSLRYILINGGYMLVSLVIMGAIIGLWR